MSVQTMHPRRSRPHLFATTALGALGMLTLVGCGAQEPGEGAEKKDSVKTMVLSAADVATAEMTQLDVGIPVSGTLQPFKTADVKSQTFGTIRGVQVDEGSSVGNGQTLGVVRAEGLESQVTSARAGVAAAESNLGLARKRFESLNELYKAGAIARLELDNAQAIVESAEQQLRSAKAQVIAASEQAGNRVISSPIAGRVEGRFVNTGEAVSPGQKLFTIVNTGVLELAGQVPAERAGEIHTGQEVSLELGDRGGERIVGRVTRIDPTADPVTRQLTIWIQVDNGGGRYVGGQFVIGKILTAGASSGVMIPIAALREKEGREYVLVVSNNTFQERDVTLGDRDEARGLVEVRSGVRPGEYVVTAPVAEIGPKVRVTIAAEKASSSKTAGSGE